MEEKKNDLFDQDCMCEDDCDCGCDYVELTDEEGNVERFAIIDNIDYQDREFVVLAPENDAENVVILEYIEEGEEGTLISVDDEELLHTVFDMFVSSFEDCGCGCGCDCDCDDDDSDCGCGCGCNGCH